MVFTAAFLCLERCFKPLYEMKVNGNVQLCNNMVAQTLLGEQTQIDIGAFGRGHWHRTSLPTQDLLAVRRLCWSQNLEESWLNPDRFPPLPVQCYCLHLVTDYQIAKPTESTVHLSLMHLACWKPHSELLKVSSFFFSFHGFDLICLLYLRLVYCCVIGVFLLLAVYWPHRHN